MCQPHHLLCIQSGVFPPSSLYRSSVLAILVNITDSITHSPISRQLSGGLSLDLTAASTHVWDLLVGI